MTPKPHSVVDTRCAGSYVCTLLYICHGQYTIETYKQGRYIEGIRLAGDEDHARTEFGQECHNRQCEGIEFGV